MIFQSNRCRCEFPKTVDREWRFVAANQEIIAGCLYCTNGQFESKPEIGGNAKRLAPKIASCGYSPDVYRFDRSNALTAGSQ